MDRSQKILEFLDKCDFRRGYIVLTELWSMANKLMTKHAPWQKDLTDESKAKASYLILESIRILQIFIYPFTPSYIKNVHKFMKYQI